MSMRLPLRHLVAAARIVIAARELQDPARGARPSPSPSTDTDAAVAVVSAARSLAQGVFLLGASRRWYRLGAVVDSLHAVSMVAYGLLRPGSGGFAQARVAGAFALAEWVLP